MKKNKHGLSRYIKHEIKQKIRQRCGFGCVVCGNAIIEYEHLDPEFKDCKVHSVDGITLLCGGCHGKKTRKFLTKETVKKFNQNPVSKREGFWDRFDLGYNYPTICFGTNEVFNCQNLIIINNKTILKIDPPEEHGAPFRLSGIFYDESGREVIKIDKNEWRGSSGSWDVEAINGKISIKSNGLSKSIIFEAIIGTLPNKIIISKLNMNYKGHKFVVSDGKFSYGSPKGATLNMIGSQTKSEILNKSFMIRVSEDGSIHYLGVDE